MFPLPITKTKLSSSAKSRKRKELVVEREDGFVREEAVPCGCTQATRITSALHPLTIFLAIFILIMTTDCDWLVFGHKTYENL